MIYILFKLCILSTFGQSAPGKVIIFISNIIQGPVVLILVLASAITSYRCFSNFMKRKAELNRTSNRENISQTEARRQRLQEKKEKNLLTMTL